MANEQTSRREVLKKAAYVTPVILTLQATPSFASNGSVLEEKDKEKGNNGLGNGIDQQPRGNPKVNDGPPALVIHGTNRTTRTNSRWDVYAVLFGDTLEVCGV